MYRITFSTIQKIVLLTTMIPALCVAKPAFTLPHGFFLGATGAITNTSIQNQLTFDPLEVEHANAYNRNVYGNTTQVQPGFILGYECVMHRSWFLGAEFQANFLKSYLNAGGSDYISNTVSANNQYALQVRLGTSLTKKDNFIYLLAGVARTTVDTKTIFDNTNLTIGALGDLQLGTVNATHHLSGLKVGVGYEKHVSKNLGLRLDYSHTQYGSFEQDLNDPTFADILPKLGISKISQSTDMLTISLVVIS
jgi:opacity protein-like surface antigen